MTKSSYKWNGHIIIELIENGQAVKRFEHTPIELQEILNKRDALPKALEWMESEMDSSIYRNSCCDGVMIWENVGLHFINANRFYEAIIVFQNLYEHFCKAELLNKNTWIHKGMPLVWIRDCHRNLGHRWLNERYLILTLIEDSIAKKGRIDPNDKGGIYQRFCLEEGYSDEKFKELSSKSYEIYGSNQELGIFPEYILLNLGIDYSRASATIYEVDNFEINKTLAEYLLERTETEKNNKCEYGDALEIFASYILGCIPGFQIEKQKQTSEYHFDGFIRARGDYSDFRADLGFYILVECKNWNKPVGTEEIGYFEHKLSVHDCKAGILFSKTGITGKNFNKDYLFGVRTILKSYHHLGRIIMILNYDDFKRTVKGESLIKILRDKYEDVRFDLNSN